ncbi:MAG: hypothetical protein ACRELX_00670, partial [Longimicrobiales bacterium]
MKLAALVLSIAAVLPAAAQSDTDLFLLRLEERGGRITVDSVVRLTDRAGYDNQPHILPGGGAVLYTSIDEAGQADIQRYDVRARRSERVTNTAPESEYSATLMPARDRFSVIRVEADSTQRLWSFRLDGTDPRVVLADIAPVGYHAWIDDDRVAVFVLGDPSTLRIADVRTGEARVIAENVGRSLHRVPGRTAISFVHREGGGDGWIKVYDPATGETTSLIEPFPENEYHAWTPRGTLLTGRGSTLYAWHPGDEGGWTEVADLSAHGVSDISRIAVSPE